MRNGNKNYKIKQKVPHPQTVPVPKLCPPNCVFVTLSILSHSVKGKEKTDFAKNCREVFYKFIFFDTFPLDKIEKYWYNVIWV